jgi:hypothetical protein
MSANGNEARLRQRLEAVTAERQKNLEQCRRLRKRLADLHAQDDKLRQEEHRLKLALLLGVPGGVQIDCRWPEGCREARLNDRRGTLTKVGRTRGVVDFGDAGLWNWKLAHLIRAGEPQGTCIPLQEEDA